ncbi:MAG: PAS domain S-box protein, partial [Nitrospirota bacterium]
EDRELAARHLTDVWQKGGRQNAELRLVRADGSEFYGRLESALVDGEPQGDLCISIIANVTRSRLTEEELKGKEETLHAVVQALREGIAFSDGEGRFHVYNRSMERLTGYTREEANATGDFNVLLYPDPEVRRAAAERLEQLKSFGDTIETEALIRAKDGSERHVAVITALVPYKDRTMYLSAFHDLTRKRKAEQERERFVGLLEETADFVGISSPEGGLLYMNRALRNLLDIPPEADISALEVPQGLTEESARRIMREGIPTALQEGRWRGEAHLAGRDGGEIPVSLLIVSHRAPDGSVTYISGVARDISELKQVEDTLRVAESAIASSINAIALGDLDGTLTFVNDSFLSLLGYANKEEVLGRSYMDFAVQKENAGRLLEVVRAEGGWIGEGKAVASDGRHRDIQISASLVRNAEGNPLCLMASFIDISGQKRTLQELRSSEEKLLSLTENSPDFILYLDRDGTILHINRAHEGRSTEEILGTYVHEYVLPEDRETLRRHMQTALRTDRTMMFEMRAVGPREYPLWYECNLGPVRLHGEVTGAVLISRDITERKNAEDALAMYREQLEDMVVKRTEELASAVELLREEVAERKSVEEALKASRRELRALFANLQEVREDERRRIASEVHDEMGQILTALKLDLAYLGKKVCPDEAAAEKLRSMSAHVDSVISAVQRITMELRPTVLDVLGLVAALEWQVREFESWSGITCATDLAMEDADIEESMATGLFRIAQEALTNVARHAEATKVTILLKREQNRILMVIEDNGRGIPEDKLDGPASLGISGIRERVRYMEGTLQVAGRSGQGTTLRVSLPLL